MGMDSVELVMAFEEEFGISIPDSAASQMLTPRQVIDFVVEQRRRVAQIDAQAHLNWILREQEVVAKVKSIVLEQLGLPEASYGEDKRFIEDFGLD